MSETPLLVSCYFGQGYQGQWPRLARVLAHTASQQCSGWRTEIRALAPPLRAPAVDESAVANTQKLEHWCACLQHEPDGARVLLIDADTLILRPLDEVWDQPFDLAVTARPSTARLPLNAGVIFVRVSPTSRAFLETWCATNRRLLADPIERRVWRLRYGGMNQAALGCVLESGSAGVELLRLPCQEWNCEDTTWGAFDATTRILHIKSALRRAVFGLGGIGVAGGSLRALVPLVRLWRAAEEAALMPQREASA
jgi:hypothetical protein